MEFIQIIAVYCEKNIKNKQISSVHIIRRFSVLKKVEHIEPLIFEWLTYIHIKIRKSRGTQYRFGLKHSFAT